MFQRPADIETCTPYFNAGEVVVVVVVGAREGISRRGTGSLANYEVVRAIVGGPGEFISFVWTSSNAHWEVGLDVCPRNSPGRDTIQSRGLDNGPAARNRCIARASQTAMAAGGNLTSLDSGR